MKKRQVRFGAVAAVLLIALVVVSLDRGTNIAWSMEQTIEAIEQVKTLYVEGTVVWPFSATPAAVSFRFWVQAPAGDSPLKMRGEIENHIMIAKGDVVYESWSDTKTAQVYYGPGIPHLKYWYKAAEFVPWVIPQLPEMIQEHFEGWTQSIDRDPATGKQRIFATCTYPPSNMSFLLIVDPKSKLLEGARLWSNLQHEGEPYVDAQKFTYNEELPEEFFEIPADMTIVDEKDAVQAGALFEQGENLFHNEKKYAEAIEVYWRVYNMYPKLNISAEALMMIGCSHDWLGQHDKAIEVLEKATREYPHVKGCIEATWFYLGLAYEDTGQKEKALVAFENCLKAGEGIRDPEKFPLKNAREFIASIKGE
jgi:tetratricopeptide (TPR) repeat protein